MDSKTSYYAWDRTTRMFHWINVLCVMVLSMLGLAIINEKAFGISAEGKILLKTLHTYVGYVFAANLLWRLLWAFVGGFYSRWKRVLPIGSGFSAALRAYTRGFIRGNPPSYVGHNPLARLMVTFVLLLLLTQGVTGLVLAGTDLYKPPFGGAIADWVTAGDADMLSQLQPGSKEYVDTTAYAEMRAFRSPIVTTHLYTFYVLVVAVILHIISVVVAEIREKNGLISAMVSGEKVLSDPPVDKT